MTAIRAVIFDLGGTLVDFPEGGARDDLWGTSYERLSEALPGGAKPVLARGARRTRGPWRRPRPGTGGA